MISVMPMSADVIRQPCTRADADEAPTYEVFVEDSRYAVPTLHLIQAADEAAARLQAQRLLAESRHHLAVELRRGDLRLWTSIQTAR
jgi:hypothetical protein